ncbi:MAG: hypothetical protein QXR42_05615 [Candidatus Bathyarchaeia archaeon]
MTQDDVKIRVQAYVRFKLLKYFGKTRKRMIEFQNELLGLRELLQKFVHDGGKL